MSPKFLLLGAVLCAVCSINRLSLIRQHQPVDRRLETLPKIGCLKLLYISDPLCFSQGFNVYCFSFLKRGDDKIGYDDRLLHLWYQMHSITKKEETIVRHSVQLRL